MMDAPRTLTIDFDAGRPLVGDVCRSNGGTYYRIVTARKVNSTANPNRWRLECFVTAERELLRDTVVWDFTWYSRSSKRPHRRLR